MSETDAAGGGDELRLSVPNRPGSLTAIRDLVRDAARLAGFGRKAAYPARVAGRLAAALMDPRLDPPEQGSIDVLVRPSGGALLVTVHDDGPPFDPRLGGRAEEFAHAVLEPGSRDWIAFANRGRVR